MSKVAVVTRQLKGFQIVVSAIIIPSAGAEASADLEEQLKQKARQYITDFQHQFREFGNAEWDVSIMDAIESD